MGIRTFTFNGESSDTYGILINKNASFNAPARAGEMISIPGRNGAYWHDLGRFENIEVTYHCVVGEATKADFVDAMSDVRSWLCGPIGYCRLEDDYNPNEYRLAVYKSGLETDEPFLTGAEFDIVFECKPQRYLTSGEAAISVASGGKVTNPTLFDAKPQLQVVGYGGITFNDKTIIVDNVPIGNIVINNSKSIEGTPATFTINTEYANVGDTISFEAIRAIRIWTSQNKISYNGQTANALSFESRIGSADSPATFVYGTSSTETNTATFNNVVVYHHGITDTYTASITITVAYDGDDTFTVTSTQVQPGYCLTSPPTIKTSDIMLDSSKSALGNPMYIDLDIGEAWNEDGGTPVSVNNSVQLPAELPTLPSGDTTITYDNTITQFEVVPRWWKV